MSTEIKNQEATVEPKATEQTVTQEQKPDENVVSLKREEYETLNQTIGSLKRELKDLKKLQDDTASSSKKSEPKKDDSVIMERLERLAIKQAGLTHEEDIDLAKATAKKWNMDIEQVLVDDDFLVKLKKQQDNRSNIQATSNVRGSGARGNAKEDPNYWIAKGVPPTPADVPDRKTRAKIARAMLQNAKTGKTFYND